MVLFVSKCINLPKMNKVPNLSFEKQTIIVKANMKNNFTIEWEEIWHVQIPIRYNPKFDHSEYSNIQILLIIRIFKHSWLFEYS